MSTKRARKPASTSNARAAAVTRPAETVAAGVDSASLRRTQASLSSTEVAQLGLRNGMTDAEIGARIKQVFPDR